MKHHVNKHVIEF